ncbi:MAG: BspA family leucine-rich repeat surface protein [Chitinophagaceae bacterium]|nr:BspA family leucine-rich repeat surface protein [Chitinophagaceae bacterium]
MIVTIVFGTASLVAQTPFITVWKTTNSGVTGNDQISIPATGDYSYAWEETTNPANNGSGTASGIVTITFPSSGTYRVSITPTGATPFNRIEFNNGGDKLKILRVEQWGSTAWSSMGNAFYGAENLTVTASDIPNLSGVTDMSHMFHGAVSLNNDNLSSWNVSNVTNMSYLFAGASTFDKNLASWDVSSVNDMSHMFHGASTFNKNLSLWATRLGNVTDMSYMFAEASAFNSNLTNWDIQSVTNMSHMFEKATSFNIALSSWLLRDVTNMSHMFDGATSFNTVLTAWAAMLGNVTDMSYMFAGATAFNSNLTNWDIQSVKDISHMFENATSFDVALSTWKLRDVTDMSYMFHNATSFNKALSAWASMVSNVTDASYMFAGATSFNSALGNWNLASAVNLSHMFENTTSFNLALGGWKVGSVKDMSYMFAGSAYNLILTNWDVSNVEDMSHMFDGATAFNKALSAWATKMGKVKNLSYMFANTTSFNSILTGWDLSSATNLSHMFAGATSFNQTLASWDVSNVKNMAYMFAGATSFDASFFNGTSDWDVSNVENMEGIFAGATAFNKTLELWNLKSLSGSISIANTGMSCENYSRTLYAWSSNPDIPSGITLNANGLNYSKTQAFIDQRQSLITDHGWVINGDALGECELAPLPVRLISFDVYTNDGGVRIKWTSANEDNFKGYTIERSRELANWNKVEFVYAKEGGQAINEYSVLDNSPYSGVSYYRIKLEDVDGAVTYSEVKKIVFNGYSSINIYPNPVQNYISISGLTTRTIVKLMDGNGRVLRVENTNTPTLNMNLSQFQKGIYNLMLISENGQIVVRRIVKE